MDSELDSKYDSETENKSENGGETEYEAGQEKSEAEQEQTGLTQEKKDSGGMMNQLKKKNSETGETSRGKKRN